MAGRKRIAQTLASARRVDWLRRTACAALLVIALSSFSAPGTAVSAVVPADGAWFIDGTGVAVQIFDCSGLLCGRIIWLEKARDTAGRPTRDNKNPDPVFRQRPLCGLTVLQGLQPAGLDHWSSGTLYNPDDGKTYRISAELHSADVFVARVYLGVPLFGETKTLLRVPRLRSEGWC
jgi:uncharacterized protein (DUF2147 family)